MDLIKGKTKKSPERKFLDRNYDPESICIGVKLKEKERLCHLPVQLL